MAEPRTTAEVAMQLLPWLWHWSIADERIGGFRSDAYAVQTTEGLVMIDALPLEPDALAGLGRVRAVVMTHRNHQRAAWRIRQEFGVPVYAPSGTQGLDEEADELMEEGSLLPGGFVAIRSHAFRDACYLVFRHEDGTGVLFCGDLLCQDPGGPYRFPVQPDYFDPVGGRQDARRLSELRLDVLCAAHAEPTLDGCQSALACALEATDHPS